MENVLTALFAYQRVEEAPRLQKMIRETQDRYGLSDAVELEDDLLSGVSAAGEPYTDPDLHKDGAT